MKSFRTIVVGDIHGTGLELSKMFKKYKMSDNDSIYFLGDLFDRGMHSFLVWDTINKYNVKCLLGNHEIKMIEFLEGKRDSLPKHYYVALNDLVKNGVDLDDLYQFLINLKSIYVLESHMQKYVLAHAGVNIKNPTKKDLSMNVYAGFPQDKSMPIVKKKDINNYWWDNYDGDEIVVYGHLCSEDSKVRIRKNKKGIVNSIGIDTSAVHGGCLTAYSINEGKFYKYKTKDHYSKVKSLNKVKLSTKVVKWIKKRKKQ